MPHGDVPVTIDRVQSEALAPRPEKPHEQKWVVSFRGKKRRLILNPPVARQIAALHGDEMLGWPGKRVTLYVERGLRAFGRQWDVIRVRPTIPPSRNGEAPPRSAALDEELDYDPSTGEVHDDAGDIEGGYDREPGEDG